MGKERDTTFYILDCFSNKLDSLYLCKGSAGTCKRKHSSAHCNENNNDAIIYSQQKMKLEREECKV